MSRIIGLTIVILVIVILPITDSISLCQKDQGANGYLSIYEYWVVNSWKNYKQLNGNSNNQNNPKA